MLPKSMILHGKQDTSRHHVVFSFVYSYVFYVCSYKVVDLGSKLLIFYMCSVCIVVFVLYVFRFSFRTAMCIIGTFILD